ncbi:MAG: hypothetical protein E6Q97_31760 [Desulfurellales bacterium]|nr:MAG: hypothetical protein E6Q97_31760 [Desulfurellales bacterium]
MSTSQHTAEVVIKGKTEGVSARLKEVADGTEKVKNAAQAAGAAQEDWGKKLDAIDSKMAGFAGGISKISGLLGAGGLTAMIGGAAAAMGEMAQRATNITAANQALKISIDAARRSTMGLVDDYTLTVAANKAVQMGVVVTDHEFGKLAKTATKLGLAMGQDAAQSVDDLTTALGRGSVEILDNLGIQLKLSDAHNEYALRLGKTADALTEAEKKIAFTTIALERAEEAAAKSNVQLDSQAMKIASLNSRWQNFKDTITTTAVDAAYAFAEWNDATAKIEMDALGYTALLEERTRANTMVGQELGGVTLELLQRFDEATGATDAWAASLGFLRDGIAQTNAQAETLANIASIDAFLQGRIDKHKTTKKPASRKPKKKKEGPTDEELLSMITSNTREEKEREKQYLDEQRAASQEIEDMRALELESLTKQREAMEEIANSEVSLWASQNRARMEAAESAELLAEREIQAELDLVEAKRQAATSRLEIMDAEEEKRRVVSKRALLEQAKSHKVEEEHRKRAGVAMSMYGGLAMEGMGAVAEAAEAAALGQEKGFARVVYAFMRSTAIEMGLVSAKEFVLAIVSAARYDFAGAAMHASAGAGAAVVAGVAGGVAAGIGSNLPSDIRGGITGSTGYAKEKAERAKGDKEDDPDKKKPGKGGKGGAGGGGGDDDGVPASYYDGGLYTKRPMRSPGASQAATGGVTVNINAGVVAGDAEQTGRALKRLIDKSGQSAGSVR